MAKKLSKAQKKFNKLLDDMCGVSADLNIAIAEVHGKAAYTKAQELQNALYLVNTAIDIIDPAVNPRYVVKVKKVK